MPNRQFYIFKFCSSWLREFNFNVNISFEQALKSKKVIALADNQMLRTIREITNHNVDMEEIEFLFYQRDKIKRITLAIVCVNAVARAFLCKKQCKL